MIWFSESMRHRGALVFCCLTVLLGSSKVLGKGRKPPEAVYPIHDQQSLEQMMEHPAKSEPSPPAVIPAPLLLPAAVSPAPARGVGGPEVDQKTDLDSLLATLVYDRKEGQYRVWIWQETGDTLWRIAQKVYGDKDKWPLIYQANKDVIKDPNKIYPKQVLKIPPVDWQP